MAGIQASFLHPFSYAPLGGGGHNSGQQLWLYFGPCCSPTHSRQALFETSENSAPMGPEILSVAGAGMWKEALSPRTFPLPYSNIALSVFKSRSFLSVVFEFPRGPNDQKIQSRSKCSISIEIFNLARKCPSRRLDFPTKNRVRGGWLPRKFHFSLDIYNLARNLDFF